MKKLMILLPLLASLCAAPVFAGQGTTYYMDGMVVQETALNWNRDIQTVTDNGDGTSRFVNHAQGYAFDMPRGFTVDTLMAASQTVLSGPGTRIEVYHDDFNGTVHTAKSYVNYNMGFTKDPRHKVEANYWTTVNGQSVHIMSWSRDKLARVPNDQNHYFVAEFVRSAREVVSVVVKSDAPIGIHDRILDSFRFTDKIGTAGNHRVYQADRSHFSEPVKAYYDAAFSKDSPQRWGIFSYGATADLTYLKSLEKSLNYQFDVLVRYQTLDTPVPVDELQRAWDDNRVVELTLQTMTRGDNIGTIYDILDGKYDTFFRDYGKALKTFGKPVLFRLNNEMNGDWCVYSAYHYSRDTELYKAMWRHIHGLFEEEGADNLLWVWNPHDLSFPDFNWNDAMNYFPGEGYVDVVGLTGYNTGTYHTGEVWRTFDEIYPKLYQEYVSTFDYPMMITEFGSNNIGGDKTAWVQDMFNKMPAYDRIKIIIWFNGTDMDAAGKPARVYRMDTGDSVQKVFADNLKRFGGLTLPLKNMTGALEKEKSWQNQ